MDSTHETRWPIYRDRETHVRPDQIIQTAWVHVDTCCLGSRNVRSTADVDQKRQELLQMGDSQPWPGLKGTWRDDGRFVIVDGGHTYIALLLLGKTHALVSWLAPNEGR